jgi:hypothetical protein
VTNEARSSTVNNDARRSAIRIATLVAAPIALLAGFVAFQILKPAPPPTPKPQSTAPVTMAERPLNERQATVCRALLSQMPEQIRDRPRRKVTAGPEQNAAFGDPAITVACGTAIPQFPPTATVWPLNGVCFYADSTGTQWTTVDREVPVQITIPHEYEQPAQWAINFSGIIAATIPSAKAPWGCTNAS